MTPWLAEDRNRLPAQLAVPRRGAEIECVVLHYTASPAEPPRKERARLERWAKGRRSSTHFAIGRDGALYQFVPLGMAAEHTSDSRAEWPPGRRRVDARSIGVDLCNVGPLTASMGRTLNCYGDPHRGAVARFDDGLWDAYTEAQSDALRGLVIELVRAVPVLADPSRWVGHAEIQPGKLDPGPAFPWPDLRAWVEGAALGARIAGVAGEDRC